MYSKTPYANVKELFDALKTAEAHIEDTAAIIANALQTIDDIWGDEIEANDYK